MASPQYSLSRLLGTLLFMSLGLAAHRWIWVVEHVQNNSLLVFGFLLYALPGLLFGAAAALLMKIRYGMILLPVIGGMASFVVELWIGVMRTKGP
ncbi:MAG: hypothetical protein J0M17_17750 [Planctomycetes bacterium]|nr:hypothetical protein [Planctomycetota bacterium]